MKVLKRLCAFLLGTSLIAGGFVALSSKKADQARATEAVAYDMIITTGGSSGYATTSTGVTCNGLDWSAVANTTMNPWRIGGKSLSSVTKNVWSESAVSSEDITKVVLTVGAASSITVNSLNLLVGTSAFNADSTEGVTSTVAGTFTANSDITFNRPSGADWSGKYFAFSFNVTVSGSNNKFVEFKEAKFYYESTTPRGDLSINSLSTPVLNVGSSTSLSYTWTPASGSSATISSYSYTSSDSDILSVSGDQITGVAPGVATVTLHATDSLSETYNVISEKIFVTQSYGFEVGDNVALYSNGALKELSSINKSGSTHYGEGADYSSTPNGTYLLNVESGTAAGSFAFKNGDNYISWSSGNSLTTATTKSDNTSWLIVAHDDYMQIANVADMTREIWWNSGNPRFACYTGKIPSSTGYNSVSLIKIEEVPIRGKIAITSPTDKVIRADASGSLNYEWTPNSEAPSVTIASHAWSSSNTAVISVSGDTYTAEGPGKAKLTLTATDSTGQEYSVTGSEIEVIDVVSGSLVKKTSVAIGDSVTFVCESEGTQLSGIASSIGQYVFYTTSPADVYMFELVSGSEANSFALKHDDKYLSWTGNGANISLVDEITTNSSWNISFDEGNAVVSNVGLDGEGHRYIAWNHSSPRFAPYLSGQTAIQLYGEASAVYDAAAFAQDLLDQTDGKCSTFVDGESDYAAFKTYFEGVWETLSGESYYGRLGSTDIGTLASANANKDSSDVVEQAMARYDLLVRKYQLDNFIDGRSVSSGAPYVVPTINNSNSSTIVIVVVALTSISSIGVLLVIKRKRSLVK